MKRHTLFISDLHLNASTPAISATFINFINTLAIKADALYILGDFFDVWIGDDDRNTFNQQIIETLSHFSKLGIPLYFMRGNRDFLIGKKFANRAGLTLLADPTVIDLYGKPTLLMHGDSLCTLDIKHQKFRRFSHRRFNQAWLLAMPLFFRRHIAKRLRHQSKQRQSTLADTIMDVTKSAVIEAFSNSHAQLLIHGHTHRPAIHTLTINDATVSRAVLGAWHHSGSVLRCDEDGQLALMDLPIYESHDGARKISA